MAARVRRAPLASSPGVLEGPAPVAPAVLRALEELGGALIVLDRHLRILAATPGAEQLLGEPVPLGRSAPKLLCGQAVERPMAEALAKGRSAAVAIPRPLAQGGERLVHARAVPLHGADAEGRVGWVLLFSDSGAVSEGSDALVEFHRMLTCDPAMKRMFRILERAALSEANVLVRGETGAGKELVASAVHAISPRRRPHLDLCEPPHPRILAPELLEHARIAPLQPREELPEPPPRSVVVRHRVILRRDAGAPSASPPPTAERLARFNVVSSCFTGRRPRPAPPRFLRPLLQRSAALRLGTPLAQAHKRTSAQERVASTGNKHRKRARKTGAEDMVR
ncbi:sigma 54-interacting transcriptional regulator [Sorangium cellulosum]|uniref:sigma 54-interacting transcriptional regulator n=1 Tax=Sorangium cellulosum TaxID=56 RepID=UPI0013ECF2D1|nr:sigma 54-interacting transcriptional regulator [Sorangium cellulosum]